MKNKCCLVCNSRGHHPSFDLCKDLIYRERGSELAILLCYRHSWELFRTGQQKFLSLYRERFMDFFGTSSETAVLQETSRTSFERWAG